MSDSALNIQLKRLIRAHMNFLSLEKKKEGAVLNAVATIIDQTIDINTKESLNCSDFQLYAASLNPQIRNYAHHIMNWWSKSTSYPSPSFSCPVDNRQLGNNVFSLSAVLKS